MIVQTGDPATDPPSLLAVGLADAAVLVVNPSTRWRNLDQAADRVQTVAETSLRICFDRPPPARRAIGAWRTGRRWPASRPDVAVAEASPGGRRFLDLGLVDVTRAPPGPLCWLAAIGFSGVLLHRGGAVAHASGFLVAALLAAISGLFLVRPLAAIVLVIVFHQSVDLWANGSWSRSAASSST